MIGRLKKVLESWKKYAEFLLVVPTKRIPNGERRYLSLSQTQACTHEEHSCMHKLMAMTKVAISQMGLKYGCLVEDVITGLSVQCKGWRSMYFNPERKGFLGIAPTTLLQTLVQHKRWSEGDFQILITRHSPFLLGHKRIPLKLQLSYCIYLLWATSWFAVLYYLVVPPLCLLRGISLFPKV